MRLMWWIFGIGFVAVLVFCWAQWSNKRWLKTAPYVAWTHYVDYSGKGWDILAQQGVHPGGTFLQTKGFATVVDAYDDICQNRLPIHVLLHHEAQQIPFLPNPQLTREENIEHLQALLMAKSA